MAATRPLRRLARRLRGPEANARRAYDRWREGVEPELRERLRVQRFGVPTQVARPTEVPAAEIAVLDDAAAIASTRAEWVLVVDPGDRLADGAVEAFARAAALAPGAAVITCDQDSLDPAGRRCLPVLRPGPSPDLLETNDLAGALVLLRREAALAGGVRLGEPGWRQAITRALTGPDGARAAHAAAVLVHTPLARGGAASVPPHDPDPARPAGAPVRGEPSVEVIIPFRDRHELLRRAVGSLLSVTAWERLRVTLVDNGSTAAPPAELLRDPRVTVVADPAPFNFAALCNAPAARSSADVLLFLNNDTETVDPQWLERLTGEAQRPDVGAVAPLLVFPDGAVQHAGAAVGLYGLAGHPFAGLAPDERGPFGAATDGTRNVLAVSAACLVIEREAFAAVGGFDPSFVIGGQDVDLGLRLTAAGRRSLCVTDVRMVHDESRSRGDRVGPDDRARSREAYGAFLADGDPFYHPGLTRVATTCGLRMPGEAT